MSCSSTHTLSSHSSHPEVVGAVVGLRGRGGLPSSRRVRGYGRGELPKIKGGVSRGQQQPVLSSLCRSASHTRAWETLRPGWVETGWGKAPVCGCRADNTQRGSTPPRAPIPGGLWLCPGV